MRFSLVAATLALAAGIVACGGSSGDSFSGQAPAIDSFALTSYHSIDPQADPKGGGPVYVVDPNFTVRAHAVGLTRVDVHAYRGASDPDGIEVAAVPDEDGWVTARLRLPDQNVVYVVDVAGILTDQSLENIRLTNENLEKEVFGGSFRVVARGPS